jgi:hypothetical protein
MMAATNPDFRDIAEGITKAAREVTYVALGFGVLGFQKAQVRRRKCQKQLARVVTNLRKPSRPS